MYKRIEVNDFRLPLSADEFITITRDDIESVRLLPPRVATAVALAFRFVQLREQTGLPPELKRYPEITYWISRHILQKHEKTTQFGERVSDHMEDIDSAQISPEDSRRKASRIKNLINDFAKIVRRKTGGKFSMGYRENHIVIFDTTKTSLDLVIGEKVFKGAILLCDKAAHGRSVVAEKGAVDYKGFAADVLIEVAAAGIRGLEVTCKDGKYYIPGIKRPFTKSGISITASGTNSYWQKSEEFRCVTMTFIQGTLRILDLSDDASLRWYEDNRGGSRVNSAYDFVVAAKALAGVSWAVPIGGRKKSRHRAPTPVPAYRS